MLLALVAAGCGGSAAAPVPPPTEHVWHANAIAVVRQLRVDIAAVAIGGTTPAEARRALARTSDLYGLLTAYSDLGGCHAMVAAAEAPPRVSQPLDAACSHLQRAAQLFARAAQNDDAAALVRATTEVRRADPQLVRASLVLRQPAHSGTRGEK